MNRVLWVLLTTALFLTLSSVQAQGLFNIKGVQVYADSSTLQQNTKKFILTDNVRISTGSGLVTCDYAEVNTETFDFEARGNVVATGLELGQELKSEKVFGNLKTKVINLPDYKGKSGPWYLQGYKAVSDDSKTITAYNVKFTTCDLGHLGYDDTYHWFADKVVYKPDGTYTAENLKTYVADVPIFYLPYFTSHLDGNDGQFKIVPGYSSDWGAFLLVSRKMRLTKEITTAPMIDFRSDDGIAFGNLTESRGPNHEFKSLLYYLPDSDVDKDKIGRFNEPSERYNVDVFHRWNILDQLTWRLKLDLVSDVEYKDEFKEGDFGASEKFDSSLNYFDLEYLGNNYSLALNAHARLNDFESSVERLPELRYDLPSFRINNSDFYYSNMNKLGYYDAKWRDFEGETPLAKPFYNNDYSSFKFDSVHSIFYDKSIDGWLNFTPRAAVRLTYYDQTSDTKVDEFDLYRRSWANDPYSRRLYLGNDYDNDGGDTLRFVGELGYELSFKAYKTNLDAQSDLFGINGIRHVIEPYINHTYIPYVSEHREHLYYFDETDRIAEQHWMRYGVKNRIQTRRDGQVHNLVTINTWLDFHLPGGENDAHEGVGDFGTNIEFDPNDEFTFNNDVIVDVDSGDINIFSLTARIGDPDKLEYSLNYLYRNDYVSKNLYSNSSSYYNSVVTSPFSRVYERRSAFTAGVRCRLWYDNFLSLSASYDFEENEFIRYMIELQRRLHAWTGALRYEEYDDEYRIMVYMYLNAYPSANFGLKESE